MCRCRLTTPLGRPRDSKYTACDISTDLTRVRRPANVPCVPWCQLTCSFVHYWLEVQPFEPTCGKRESKIFDCEVPYRCFKVSQDVIWIDDFTTDGDNTGFGEVGMQPRDVTKTCEELSDRANIFLHWVTCCFIYMTSVIGEILCHHNVEMQTSTP